MRRLSALVLLLAGLLPGPAAAQDEDPMNPLLRVVLRTEMPEQLVDWNTGSRFTFGV